jgi:hypothetical protein
MLTWASALLAALKAIGTLLGLYGSEQERQAGAAEAVASGLKQAEAKETEAATISNAAKATHAKVKDDSAFDNEFCRD